MNVNQQFFFDLVLASTSLFVLIYIIYGRIRRKSLIGGYKPGVAGYDIFIKFVENKRYLALSAIISAVLIVNLAFGFREVLKSPYSHSILFVGPAMIIIGFGVAFGVILPNLFDKNQK